MKARKDSGKVKGSVFDSVNDMKQLLANERLQTWQGAEKIENQIQDQLKSIEMKYLNYKLEREERQKELKADMVERNQRILDSIATERDEREITNKELMIVLEDAQSEQEKRFVK